MTFGARQLASPRRVANRRVANRRSSFAAALKARRGVFPAVSRRSLFSVLSADVFHSRGGE